MSAKDYPVESVQEIASIMKFINEVMAKMREDDHLSPEAMAGLQCLMVRFEGSMTQVGTELAGWKKVSGPPKKIDSGAKREGSN